MFLKVTFFNLYSTEVIFLVSICLISPTWAVWKNGTRNGLKKLKCLKSYLCSLMWWVRLDLKLKLCSQIEQLNGFSLVWILECSAKVYFLLKEALQTEQVKGLSSVWTLVCITKSCFLLNAALQTEQPKGFSSLWHLMCRVRHNLRPKLWPQTEQLWGVSPVWIFVCSVKFILDGNALLQKKHL